MRYNDDLMRWYVGTRRGYDNIPVTEIDENGSYFLLDTKEIVLDGVSFPGLIIFYSGNKPSNPSTQRFYYNTDDCEISVWTGTKWLVIYGVANAQLISADPNIPPSERVISANVVKDYAQRILIDTLKESIAFVNLKYNPERSQLQFQIGNNRGTYTISNIGNKILLESSTGKMCLLDENNVVISSVTLFPTHIIAGEFNFIDKTVDFTFSTGGILKVPAAGLLNMFEFENTPTIVFDSTSFKSMTMSVRLSASIDNDLKEYEDGLFLSYLGYMERIAPGMGDLIFIANKEGSPQTDHYYKISSSLINRSNDAEKVVTEFIVYHSLQPVTASFLRKSSIWIDPNKKYNYIGSLCMQQPNT